MTITKLASEPDSVTFLLAPDDQDEALTPAQERAEARRVLVQSLLDAFGDVPPVRRELQEMDRLLTLVRTCQTCHRQFIEDDDCDPAPQRWCSEWCARGCPRCGTPGRCRCDGV